jgi:rod shape-determining protein MreD
VRLVILFAIAAFIALAIQIAFRYWLPTWLIPDLIVILAVDLGLRHHSVVSAVLAFAMGYAVDALSGTVLGVNAFLITLIFLLTYELSSRLLTLNAFVGVFAVFVGVLVSALGTIAISNGLGAVEQAGPMVPGLLITAAISAAVAPLVFAALAQIKGLIGLPAGPVRE